MNKKKIIKGNTKGYYQTWKSKNYKIVNFSWYGDEGLTYAIWFMEKQKVGIKKPYADYIGKLKIDEYLALKPTCYKYQWFCVMHAGYGSKIKDFRKYVERYKWLKEMGKNSK